MLDRWERRPVALALEFCVRQRHRRSTCTRCVDVCPVGAITWDNGLEIDREACTGCGICAAVCPTAALEASGSSNDELLAQVQRAVERRGWVAFACPRARQGGGAGAPGLTVSCLGRLDEGLLVSAAACGAQSTWLVDGACEGCPQAVGRAVAGAALARCNALLEAFGVPARAAFRPDLPGALQAGGGNGSAEGVSRRGLFKVLARETARAGQIGAGPEQGMQARPEPRKTVGDLPRALPSSRLLLLAALKRLGAPVAAALAGEEDGPFARFALGERCTGCQMCAFFCPTGALVKVEDEGRVGLAFRSALCTNCGLCRDICYRDAVVLDHQVDLNDVLAVSVDWLFVGDMEDPPWKKPPDRRVTQAILGMMNQQTE
jgi:ferredoxin